MLYFVIALAFLFLFFCILSIKYRLAESRIKRDDNLVFGTGLGVLVCLAVSTGVVLLLREDALAYPFQKSLDYCNAYEQMFDAFMKRQLHIDVAPSDELVLMGNPYDSDLRKELDVSFLWDRAYFGGRYYSYFGIAPLLLIYFPYYFLTHTVPRPQTVCFIMSLFLIPAAAALTVKMQRLFSEKLNPTLLLFSVMAVESASLVFMLQSSADNYYIPVESGVLFLSLFLLTTLCAYEKRENINKSRLFFFLSGVCLVLIVMSRPNMAVYFLMAVPVYLHFLLSKDLKPSGKLLTVLCFAVPTAIGAAAVMYYNYIRFESVFEFGTSYQLTVHDVREYAYSAELIMPMFYYYFFKQPAFSKNIPYLLIPFVGGLNVSGYIYLTSTVGAFSFPSSWSLVFAPAALYGQKNKVKAGIVLTGMACILFTAYTDICFAGVNLRYLADISFITALLSTVVIADIFELLSKKGGKAEYISFVIICLAYVYSFLLGIMLIINNERDYIVKEYFGG